jgi:hypothetical protein
MKFGACSLVRAMWLLTRGPPQRRMDWEARLAPESRAAVNRRMEGTCSLLLLATPPQPVKAQRPGTGSGQIEEDETVKRRQFTGVEDRKKPA